MATRAAVFALLVLGAGKLLAPQRAEWQVPITLGLFVAFVSVIVIDWRGRGK